MFKKHYKQMSSDENLNVYFKFFSIPTQTTAVRIGFFWSLLAKMYIVTPEIINIVCFCLFWCSIVSF